MGFKTEASPIWREAIEDAVQKIKNNMEKYEGKFPHITEGKRYEWGENMDWIEGFYTGMAWLCYEYNGDRFFRDRAVAQVENFRNRMQANVYMDHHDLGFLYSLSAFAGWVVEKNESCRELALQAAEILSRRWREKSQLIQAWGPEGHPQDGGRIIIDCLMNLPLLYWASEETGNPRYADIACKHAQLARRFLVRGDDSSYHTFFFDQETGNAIRGGTAQGYSDGSTWTRGQAWGIYGFALSYRFTGKKEFLDTAKRMAKYFIDRIPEDGYVYWDFEAPITSETKRDSSASAIAVCGMLEIAEHLQSDDEFLEELNNAIMLSMKGLVEKCSTIGKDAEGLIDHGSYSVRANSAPDDYMIWGDYYYLEALLRLEKNVPGYWYERK